MGMERMFAVTATVLSVMPRKLCEIRSFQHAYKTLFHLV